MGVSFKPVIAAVLHANLRLILLHLSRLTFLSSGTLSDIPYTQLLEDMLGFIVLLADSSPVALELWALRRIHEYKAKEQQNLENASFKLKGRENLHFELSDTSPFFFFTVFSIGVPSNHSSQVIAAEGIGILTSSKAILAIFEATGYQYFLRHPKSPYQIRTPTRNLGSAKPTRLSTAEASIVQADLKHVPRNLFLLLWFPAKEIEQGKPLYPSVTENSGGKFKKMMHFDSEAEIKTVLWISTYFLLWLQFPAIWILRLPAKKTKMPMVDIGNTRKFVDGIVAKGVRGFGERTVSMVSGGEVTQTKVLDIWGKFVGRNVGFQTAVVGEYEEYIKSLGLREMIYKDMEGVSQFLGNLDKRFLPRRGLRRCVDLNVG
ncbi:uncharacterized protein BDR25DRAFT_359383 [Lindgomyces ingoldianus]|uniref:Uncharacterized protein n=1 Tax=Lindgomyces ingoldianus TaxID=673940 RepID=A0ACB6QHL5_9PLEO|nr:uncharacterized protein BDR25DRAFT_359383 [Lindgomyces ingoldianus]KAF2466489.1 hypothetical protein BDR25DRAFT_359383 [Lindgomyces ingoldianus]